MLPGLTIDTRTPGSSRASCCRVRTSPRTAHLDVAYDPMNGTVAWPSTEPITTSDPPPRAAKAFSAERATLAAPITLMRITWSHTSGGRPVGRPYHVDAVPLAPPAGGRRAVPPGGDRGRAVDADVDPAEPAARRPEGAVDGGGARDVREGHQGVCAPRLQLGPQGLE